MDAAILDVYGNQSVGTGGADPVQLSADAGSTGNYLYDVKEKEGAVALTCGSSFYISNTKRRASKSPAFVV